MAIERLVPTVGVTMELRYFESELPQALAAAKKILVQLLETVAYANSESPMKSLEALPIRQ
jgi:hypothetical protein